MMRGSKTELCLLVTPDGRPGCVRIELGASAAHQAAIPLSKPSPVGAGPLQTIQLQGQGLGSLCEVERWQLLRHCRHLLVPGGQVSMPVGTGANEFPTAVLNDIVWLSGFESWVDFVTGCAVLTKPRREAQTDSLVSIVMPSYKEDFFAEALASAQAQTWPHCEIVVCDDGPGEGIGQIARASEGPHPVRYFRNPKNLGGWANYVRSYELARGRYIKFLNDDDLLHRECVARMATILDERPAVTLVTGYRELIDEVGGLLPDEIWNAPLVSTDTGIPGGMLIGLALTLGVNQIGEPTTAMFRRADLADNRPHLMSYAGRAIPRNGDMTMWASLLSRGDAVYLSEAMSSFRQHGTQVQKNPAYQSEGMAAWFALRKAAAQTGLPQNVSSLGPMPFSLHESCDVAAGEKLFSEGDAQGALPIFAAALHLSPDNVRARGDLACAAWELGQGQRALIEGVLAHCCDPNDENIALNLQDMMELGI